jgi:RimJ/RimL family protein N-acetyltransferase
MFLFSMFIIEANHICEVFKMIAIRTITLEDTEKFWSLRLEALKISPENFGATYEESVDLSIESVRARIGLTDDKFILGAFSQEDELVGMVGFWKEQSLKVKHKGNVWGMYVTDKHRRQGLGTRLIQELIKRAEKLDGLEQINLCVVTTNQPARTLYISLGFEIYGIERNAMKYNGQKFDEELMTYKIMRNQWKTCT